MVTARSICGGIIGYTLGYGTVKLVKVRSVKIGLVNRIIQISIIAYVIGYAIIYEKGYQAKDIAQSSATTKVKGIASTVDNLTLPKEYRRVWDAVEFVPGQENNAFFVLTNAILTPNQVVDICPEDPNIRECNPNERKDCIKGVPVENGHGIMTGQCIQSVNPKKFSCEIRGWCPVERDELLIPDRPLIPEAMNFTVFIKNNIEFPKFRVRRSNVLDEQNNESYLKKCRNDPKSATAKYCPVFRLGDMVKATCTNGKTTNFFDIATRGGVIHILIKWDCNLDQGEKKCLPAYEFRRLDDPPVPISRGYNFRYARYFHRPDQSEGRDLIKAYGLLFIVTVEGHAGRFSIVPLAFNIGAGLGLLGLATFLTDFVLLHLTKRRKDYKEHKYTKVTASDFAKVKRKITKAQVPVSVINLQSNEGRDNMQNDVISDKV